MTKCSRTVLNGGPWPEQTRLKQVIDDAQELAGRLMMADRDQARHIVEVFSAAIPRPVNQLEQILLRSVLLNVAYKTGLAVHNRVHGGRVENCDFSPTVVLDRFWSENADPLTQFDHWSKSFFELLNETHPPSVGSSVARLIKRDVRQSWTLGRLAAFFHVTPSKIRRSFQREFRVSMGDYQRLARLLAALDLVRSDKMAVAALSVGFRSTKNFCRAFARLIGITPSKFRQLSNEQAADIRVATALRLLRRHDDVKSSDG